jgi:hypothetical protein
MFGNCLWLQLSSTHNINQIIYNFHKLFGTQQHKAHITIEYDTHFPQDYEKYNFYKTGEIYKTCEDGFYAVQQDYVSDGFPNKTFHISLAYKDKDFTFQEMYFINSCDIPDFISKNDLSIHLWDCNSKFPNDWKFIC